MTTLSSAWGRAKVFRYKASAKLKIFLLEAFLRPVRPAGMLRFGTYYGGWWIPEINPGLGAAFCVGAGTDVTFDLELQRLGYRVYTVDPTPAAVEYMTEHVSELNFIPVGVWTENGELEFAQDKVWSDSWMIGAKASSSTGIQDVQRFPVTTVRDLIESTGETDVAVLKLDIEGAEHEVLASLIADGVRPHCLCVEFDDHRIRQVVRSTRRLQEYGYDLYQIEGLNYIFVRHDRPKAGEVP